MRVVIEGGAPRNSQCGDWQYHYKTSTIQITVLKMPTKSAVAVAVHELIEYLLCQEAGIGDLTVTQFDAQFEAEREAGKHPEESEAGDDPRSPYRTQHEAATFAERAVVAVLGLSWQEHDRNVQASLE